MENSPPPPVLDSARVLSYGFVDDIPYRRWDALYVGGDLVEHVARLAICISLGNDSDAMLLHCDEQWNVLGTSGATTMEAVKQRAERNYPGVRSRWVDILTTHEDAIRYYDQQTGGLKCSFCGKRPFEVDGWVQGKQAIICKNCIELYHGELHSGDA